MHLVLIVQESCQFVAFSVKMVCVAFPPFIVRSTLTPSVMLMLHTGLCMTQRLPWILGWISFKHRCCDFHHVWREQWEWCLIKLVLGNNLSAAVGPFQGHVLRRRPWTSSVPAAFYVLYQWDLSHIRYKFWQFSFSGNPWREQQLSLLILCSVDQTHRLRSTQQEWGSFGFQAW